MANQLPLSSGNIIAASFVATIQPANTSYVFNSASLELAGETITVTNENGAVTAVRAFEGALSTGSAEIQVNASAEQQDLRGNYFITTAFDNTNVNCIIVTQSAPVVKNTARVYNITFFKALS